MPGAGLAPTEAQSQLSGFSIDGYDQETLICNIYVETTWGNGSGEWGDPAQLGRSHDMVAPLAFNNQGEFYFSDFANQRLLKYDSIKSTRIQRIPLPTQYFSIPTIETLRLPWYSIAVTPNNIIIPYDLQMIGILSLDGEYLKNIQLPYRYNFMAPTWRPVWFDSRGGLLFNGETVAYFDPGWEDEEWNEVTTGSDFIINPFSWHGYIGGQSGVQPDFLRYKIDQSTDFLKEPIVIDAGVGAGGRLIGADEDGWIYVEKTLEGGNAIARYGIQSGTKQFGIIGGEGISDIIQSNVSPSGDIYLIVFDREDATIEPSIVKCKFAD